MIEFGRDDALEQLREHARQVAEREHAAIEEACKKALQLGDRGVLVIREPVKFDLKGPTYSAASTTLVGPSELVPPGHIWYCPSLEAAIAARTTYEGEIQP